MKNDTNHTPAPPTTAAPLITAAPLALAAPQMTASHTTASLKAAPIKAPSLTPASFTPALPTILPRVEALKTAPFRIAPFKASSLTPARFTPVSNTPAPLTTAPLMSAVLKTAKLILLIATILFFLVGCKTKESITENTTTKIDSTALWNLNDSLYKKETQIATLQSDLQRVRDENIRLLNESSIHQISYDTSAPVNPQTGKPPIASETISLSKSSLEETKKELETLLQTASLENEALTQQNHSLQLTVDKLTNENKQLTEKTASPAFNFKLFLAGLISGILLSLITCFIIRKFIGIYAPV